MTIDSIKAEFLRYKALAERALTQAPDEMLNTVLCEGDNSLSTLIRHMSGNLTSRYTDFAVEGVDGEKTWRNRDGEFIETELTRVELMEVWNAGFSCLENVLNTLADDDFSKKVVIRGVELRIDAALNRSLAHFTYHVGQIVQLSRFFAKDSWQGLTVLSGGHTDGKDDVVRW